MKKTQLQAKTRLKGKTPLKARTSLMSDSSSKSVKRTPLLQKTAQQLIREADKPFSKYIRLRDSEYINGEWWGTCVSCDKRYLVRKSDGKWTNLVDNGHFVSRGHMIVRYDEENCNLQCKRCNKWLNGNYTEYKYRLDNKYGYGTAGKLEDLAHTNPTYRQTKPELLQIISDSKTQLEFIERQAYGTQESS